MKAVWFERRGPARDVLVVGEMPDPTPDIGQVRVRVHVSGVNPTDTKTRGTRMAAIPTWTFSRIIPGQDGAGVDQSRGSGRAGNPNQGSGCGSMRHTVAARSALRRSTWWFPRCTLSSCPIWIDFDNGSRA